MLAAALTLAAMVPNAAFAARELCRFTTQGLEVTARDVTAEGGEGVEIDVSDGPLVLTRVAIPAAAGAAGCWQLDIDGDRRFELLLGLVQDAGARPPRLVRFEWNGSLLEALPMADLDLEQGRGYQGGDALELRDGFLIRSFVVSAGSGTGSEKRHFRYDAEADRWIRLQALKRQTPSDAKPEAPSAPLSATNS